MLSPQAPLTSCRKTLALLRQVAVTLPATDVSPAFAAFSGKWEGFATEGRRRILVVEWIMASGQASAIHGWADEKKPEEIKSYRYKARVEDGVLRFGTGSEYKFVFAAGKLHGKIFKEGAEQPWGEIMMTRGEPTPSSPYGYGIYADEESKRICEEYIPSKFFEIVFYAGGPGGPAADFTINLTISAGSVKLTDGRCVASGVGIRTSSPKPGAFNIKVDSAGDVHFLNGPKIKKDSGETQLYEYIFQRTLNRVVFINNSNTYTNTNKGGWRLQ